VNKFLSDDAAVSYWAERWEKEFCNVYAVQKPDKVPALRTALCAV
jgi:hypothetical protein